MKTVLVLGANSDIARATIQEFSAGDYQFILGVRDVKSLEDFGKSLGDKLIETVHFDAGEFDSHKEFYSSLKERPDVILSCFGYASDPRKAKEDFNEARKDIDINLTANISILEPFAAEMEKRKSGTIIVISSVAGDRGKARAYMYDTAKAGLNAYLSGLRQRLVSSGVHVMTVKPGFVYTKMTEGMKLPKALTANPEQVGRDIYKGYKRKRNVIYSTWKWFWIMLIIKSIPESIFKKLSL